MFPSSNITWTMPIQGQGPYSAGFGQPWFQGQAPRIPIANGWQDGTAIMNVNPGWPQLGPYPTATSNGWGAQGMNWIPTWNGNPIPTIPQGWTPDQGAPRPQQQQQVTTEPVTTETTKVRNSVNDIKALHGKRKRPTTVVIDDNDTPPHSKARKLSKATHQAKLPKINRNKKLRTLHDTKPKRFEESEWRRHKKLADLAHRLAQFDFHIDAWNSDDTSRIDDLREAYFNVMLPPGADSEFLALIDHIKGQNARIMKDAALNLLVRRHNEALTELKISIRSSKTNPAILDKAMQMYNLRRHERWDPVIYRNRMRDVRDYCVSNKKCHRLEPYKPMASRSKDATTQTDTPDRARMLSEADVVDIIEPPMRNLHCTSVQRSLDVRLNTIEDGISPPIISPHPSPLGIAVNTPAIRLRPINTHSERFSMSSPIVDSEMESILLDLNPHNGQPLRDTTQMEHTAGTLLRSMESLTDGQNLGNPEMKRIIRVLLRITLSEEDIPILPQWFEYIDRELLESLQQCTRIATGLRDSDLEKATVVIADHLTSGSFINTPKTHRIKQIHKAFSIAFGRDPWWRSIEKTFSFLRKTKIPQTIP